jgi:hypothetical protein
MSLGPQHWQTPLSQPLGDRAGPLTSSYHRIWSHLGFFEATTGAVRAERAPGDAQSSAASRGPGLTRGPPRVAPPRHRL